MSEVLKALRSYCCITEEFVENVQGNITGDHLRVKDVSISIQHCNLVDNACGNYSKL